MKVKERENTPIDKLEYHQNSQSHNGKWCVYCNLCQEEKTDIATIPDQTNFFLAPD